MSGEGGSDRKVEAPGVKLEWANITAVVFALLQSACTAVLAISGFRVLIGLSALAAAAGVHAPAKGFSSGRYPDSDDDSGAGWIAGESVFVVACAVCANAGPAGDGVGDAYDDASGLEIRR